jgi:hypothetical protein
VFFATVGKKLGLHHQTVERCVERALAYGPLAALDDRPRPGKEQTITSEAKAWLVSLACEKAKDHGYPHELRTTRLLARHARAKAPAAGMNVSLTWPRAQSARFSAKRKSSRTRCGTIWNGVMPSLSKRWRKSCVYREVQVLKKNTTISADHPVAIVSYDEKPGIQAIATTAPDLPPQPGVHATFTRDHEYTPRHGEPVGRDRFAHWQGACAGQGPPPQSRVHRIPEASRCCLPGPHCNQTDSR